MLRSFGIGATAEPDSEQWFIEFEGHLASEVPAIQRDRWLEQLKLQCGTDVDPIFARAVTDAGSHQEFASDRKYELVWARMLLECISTD